MKHELICGHGRLTLEQSLMCIFESLNGLGHLGRRRNSRLTWRMVLVGSGRPADRGRAWSGFSNNLASGCRWRRRTRRGFHGRVTRRRWKNLAREHRKGVRGVVTNADLFGERDIIFGCIGALSSSSCRGYKWKQGQSWAEGNHMNMNGQTKWIG